MVGVISLFLNICLLRHGPESVPTQTWFLLALIAADVAIGGAGFALLADVPLSLALGTPVLGLAVLGSLTWFGLYVRDKDERFLPTFAALVGCEVLISVPMLPALAVLTAWPIVQGTFALAFQIWQIVVNGFILGRALDTTLRVGILVAFGMWLIAIVVLQATLPPPPAASP